MSKKPGRFSKIKKAAIIAATAATVVGVGILGVTFHNSNKHLFLPVYRVIQVIDGDTFMTKEIQYIRDNAYDAPELDQCGGQEAKRELEKTVISGFVPKRKPKKPVLLRVRVVPKNISLQGETL